MGGGCGEGGAGWGRGCKRPSSQIYQTNADLNYLSGIM